MRVPIALFCAMVVAAGAVAAADARTPSPTSVHVSACQLSPTRTDRSATFVSTMNAVPGTSRMAMRFRLRRRTPGGATAPIRTPALEAWRRARPGVRTFTYTQRVNGLATTTVYWMAIDYRWLDASGHVIRTATRYSPVCSQVGPLNNLKIRGVTARQGAESGTAVYDFTIANNGRALEHSIKLRLVVDNADAGTGTIDSIGAGQSRMVELTGPVCGRRLHLVLQRPGDPRREVLGWHCPPLQ